MLRGWVLGLMALVGCAEAPPGNVVSVGQNYEEARRVAEVAGLVLHDAAGMAILPPPDGFYVDLEGNVSLLVTHDAAGRVDSLVVISNASRPKAERTWESVERYELRE